MRSGCRCGDLARQWGRIRAKSGTDWVKNITAAGGFELETKRTVVLLIDPVVQNDPSARWAPPVVRQALKAMSASYYLQARQA
ncbi:hypothetical protein [Nocardia sp. CA-119907]|uniref:hypothetical protein n=1 Tax=Nocardia sp. CA-119907 TaxID=3239973 RepID=UPI003D98646D